MAHGHDERRQVGVGRELRELDLALRVLESELRIASCSSFDICGRCVLAESSPPVTVTLVYPSASGCGRELQIVDGEVDAGERRARVVDDLQLGGAVRGVARRSGASSALRWATSTSTAASGSLCEIASASWRTAPSGDAAPPLPNIDADREPADTDERGDAERRDERAAATARLDVGLAR